MPLDREILERTEQTSLVICVTYSGADAGHTEQKERPRPYSSPQINYLQPLYLFNRLGDCDSKAWFHLVFATVSISAKCGILQRTLFPLRLAALKAH